jgi:hypothetical protein
MQCCGNGWAEYARTSVAGSTRIFGRLDVALHHIKFSDETGTLANAPDAIAASHGIEQVRAHGVESEGNKLENVLCNLNALLEQHLQEWLALPQSKRVELALQELKKL